MSLPSPRGRYARRCRGEMPREKGGILANWSVVTPSAGSAVVPSLWTTIQKHGRALWITRQVKQFRANNRACSLLSDQVASGLRASNPLLENKDRAPWTAAGQERPRDHYVSRSATQTANALPPLGTGRVCLFYAAGNGVCAFRKVHYGPSRVSPSRCSRIQGNPADCPFRSRHGRTAKARQATKGGDAAPEALIHSGPRGGAPFAGNSILSI